MKILAMQISYERCVSTVINVQIVVCTIIMAKLAQKICKEESNGLVNWAITTGARHKGQGTRFKKGARHKTQKLRKIQGRKEPLAGYAFCAVNSFVFPWLNFSSLAAFLNS